MEEYELDGYKLLQKIGEGTYGDVYKVERIRDKKILAIKFIRFRESSITNGVSVSTIREIRFLKNTDHENIVKLYDIVSPQVDWKMDYTELKPICMIMDYIEHDLWGILHLAKEQKLSLYSPMHIKWYMYQILQATAYLHKNHIMHRDIKTSNILVSNQHIIKMTDFGLARKLKIGNDWHYTNNVMTLWYRPPELLLGETQYSTETDIWSVGCILGEILTGVPIFSTSKNDEKEELHVIYKACGYPNDEYIRGMMIKQNMEFKHFPPNLKKHLQGLARAAEICNPDWVTDEVMGVLQQMLVISPKERKTAEELLQNAYFDDVRSGKPDLPPYPESLCTHRFQVKTPPAIVLNKVDSMSTHQLQPAPEPEKNGTGSFFDQSLIQKSRPTITIQIKPIILPAMESGRKDGEVKREEERKQERDRRDSENERRDSYRNERNHSREERDERDRRDSYRNERNHSKEERDRRDSENERRGSYQNERNHSRDERNRRDSEKEERRDERDRRDSYRNERKDSKKERDRFNDPYHDYNSQRSHHHDSYQGRYSSKHERHYSKH